MSLPARNLLTVTAAGLGAIAITGVVYFGFPPLLLLIPLAIITAVTIGRPWFGIMALVAIVPFNGLASDLLLVSGQTETALFVGAAKDVVLAGLVVAAFKTGQYRRVSRDILIIVLSLLIVGSIAAIWTPDFEQAAYGWRNDFEPLVLLLVVPIFVTEQISRRIVLALAIAAQFASLVAIISWSVGTPWVYSTGRLPVPDGQAFPSSLFVHNSEWPRAFSPFSGPNELAVAMAIMVAVIICQRQWKLWIRAILSGAPVVAVILAQSRSGQLGVIVVLITITVWALWRLNKVWAILFSGIATFMGAVGAIYYASSQQGLDGDPSLGGHARSLTESVALIVDHPFGNGLGQVGPRALRYTSDPIRVESFWLLLALEAGVLALVLFVVLLGRLIQISLRARTLGAFTITAVIAASFVSQLVLPTLQDTSVAYILWICVGIGLQAAGHLRPSPKAGTSSSPEVSPPKRAIKRPGLGIGRPSTSATNQQDGA